MNKAPYESPSLGPVVGDTVVLNDDILLMRIPREDSLGLYGTDGADRPWGAPDAPISRFKASETARVTSLGIRGLFVKVITESGSEGWIFWRNVVSLKN